MDLKEVRRKSYLHGAAIGGSYSLVSLLLLCALMGALLASCSSSGPAPVVSRERGSSVEERSPVVRRTSGSGVTIRKYGSEVTPYRPQAVAIKPRANAPKQRPVVSTAVPKPKPVLPPPKPKSNYYVVQHGDTLYSIAWKLSVDHTKLAIWNGIGSPYTIYAGQRLRIKPGQGESVAVVAQGPVKSAPKSTVATEHADVSQPKSTAVIPTVKWKPIPSVKLRWKWPTKGRIVQQYSRKSINHKGIKIAGSRGQKIAAAETGKVVYVGDGLIGYGQLIIIKHNREYLSAYGYNRKLLVKEGDVVSRGAKIAEMGDGGSGRAQLHFEVRRNGTPVDPAALLSRR